jgi:hypothetical protein
MRAWLFLHNLWLAYVMPQVLPSPIGRLRSSNSLLCHWIVGSPVSHHVRFPCKLRKELQIY